MTIGNPNFLCGSMKVRMAEARGLKAETGQLTRSPPARGLGEPCILPSRVQAELRPSDGFLAF